MAELPPEVCVGLPEPEMLLRPAHESKERYTFAQENKSLIERLTNENDRLKDQVKILTHKLELIKTICNDTLSP